MNQVEKTQQTQITAPNEMIQQALSGGADLEKLEKLLEIQMKWEANEAKKSYVKAMAAFKENPPKIIKKSNVNFSTAKGTTNYNYANLADVTEQVNKELSKYGLSASWTTKQNGQICVTCKITHSSGHSEETTLCASADQSGNKNSIQAIGSTITYLQRYTLLSLCGLATHEQDDDGKSTEEIKYITKEQAEEIDKLIKETGSDVMKFLEYMHVEKYNDILASDYQKALNPLKNKKRKDKKCQ